MYIYLILLFKKTRLHYKNTHKEKSTHKKSLAVSITESTHTLSLSLCNCYREHIALTCPPPPPISLCHPPQFHTYFKRLTMKWLQFQAMILYKVNVLWVIYLLTGAVKHEQRDNNCSLHLMLILSHTLHHFFLPSSLPKTSENLWMIRISVIMTWGFYYGKTPGEISRWNFVLAFVPVSRCSTADIVLSI